MGQRLGLIIGNSEYDDKTLAQLAAPNADVASFAEILLNPELGQFDNVDLVVNSTSPHIHRLITKFFSNRMPDDLLVLYFSGHGILDDRGRLYLAAKDTERDLLRGTAIPASFITDEMDNSRSRRQVLVLDCCHSGAFARGAKGALGGQVGTALAFEGKGYGRVVLTATDSTQYAWEGDQVIGQAENSLFTHYMIQGIKTGEADRSGDGLITIDELYDYAYEWVISQTPKQTPGKWSFREQGEIIIARNPKPRQPKVKLPEWIIEVLAAEDSAAKLAAISRLQQMAESSDPVVVAVAMEELQRVGQDDQDPLVRRTAAAALDLRHEVARSVTGPRPVSTPQKEKAGEEELRRADQELQPHTIKVETVAEVEDSSSLTKITNPPGAPGVDESLPPEVSEPSTILLGKAEEVSQPPTAWIKQNLRAFGIIVGIVLIALFLTFTFNSIRPPVPEGTPAPSESLSPAATTLNPVVVSITGTVEPKKTFTPSLKATDTETTETSPVVTEAVVVPTTIWKIVFLSQQGQDPQISLINSDGSGRMKLTKDPAQPQRMSVNGNQGLIAFESRESPSLIVYVIGIDGSNQKRLTSPSVVSWLPALSPNGSKVAYTSCPEETQGYCSNTDIFLMNTQGGKRVQLTTASGSDYDPVWSPNGSYIAFISNRGNINGSFVYLMNPDGSKQNFLHDGYVFSWSPDGNQLAVVQGSYEETDIFLVQASGEGITRLTDSPGIDEDPAWSPDGKKIAFVSERDGNKEIYAINTDGNQLIRLTQNPGEDTSPAWSPDGRQIAFISTRDGNREIYVMNADGSQPTRLTQDPDDDLDPAWLPIEVKP